MAMPAAVRLLLSWGSDPNGRNTQGEMPLAGVAFKRGKMVRWLLARGMGAVDAIQALS